MEAENLRKCETIKLNFLCKVMIIFKEKNEQNHCGKFPLLAMGEAFDHEDTKRLLSRNDSLAETRDHKLV